MDFWGDRRGQPVQIGFILLFGILVLAFASYQGYVVPNQNAEIEFQHSQEVTGDMQTFRVNLLNAAENGQRSASEFRLGTNYPPRLIALNPPPASGTLRTESLGSGELRLVAGDESLEDICGYSRDGDGAVPSKGLVYQPSYSEMRDEPRVVYENTVSYRAFESSGAVRFDSEQTLIDGNKITVPPLVGNVSKHGTQTHTVDVYPGKAGVGDTAGTSVKLIVPTDLTVAQWEELLADEITDGPVTGVSANGSDVDIELEPAEYDIVCPVVGTSGAPENNPDRVRGAGDDINPGGAGDVRLSDVGYHSNNGDVVTLAFTNPGDDVNISAMRFNFYEPGNNDPPSQLDVSEYNRNDPGQNSSPFIEDLELRGEAKSPSESVELEGGDSISDIAVEFEDSSGNLYDIKQDHFFVIHIRFSDGQQSNYFIDMPKTGATLSSGTGGVSTNPSSSGFNSVSAQDIAAKNNVPQTFTFELDGSLSSGESVEIDLTDPIDNGIDYSGASVNSVSGGTGDAELNGNTIVYTSAGDSDSTSISISLDENVMANRNEGTYSVTFLRSDASESASDTFTAG